MKFAWNFQSIVSTSISSLASLITALPEFVARLRNFVSQIVINFGTCPITSISSLVSFGCEHLCSVTQLTHFTLTRSNSIFSTFVQALAYNCHSVNVLFIAWFSFEIMFILNAWQPDIHICMIASDKRNYFKCLLGGHFFLLLAC